MARRKILFCFSICLEISLPPEITPQLISFLNSSSSPSQCYHTSPQQGIKVHHLDVPNSERLSRCDRILGAACVKRRALKKLELASSSSSALDILPSPSPSKRQPSPRAYFTLHHKSTYIQYFATVSPSPTWASRSKAPEARLQQPAPSGIFPLPPAWEVAVPSLLMVQLRMPQNMADRLANTVGSDTAGQIRQLQRLLGPSSERRYLVFTLLA
ncbi:hypothetical protein BFJ68_g15283 [Fusarium oxysporum]|uniref:Uncharacterized protein n=1 Tax=Fusarium oxysporum TaxID=5507 RepID=A0A420PNP3_FUSOX|nr:hypothetical protein BFJ71_g14663 [Fusarium oxysporum]RKK94126.1 hypothetical protein BFJ68_g15283 [Fusarium oxysporum]